MRKHASGKAVYQSSGLVSSGRHEQISFMSVAQAGGSMLAWEADTHITYGQVNVTDAKNNNTRGTQSCALTPSTKA